MITSQRPEVQSCIPVLQIACTYLAAASIASKAGSNCRACQP